MEVSEREDEREAMTCNKTEMGGEVCPSPSEPDGLCKRTGQRRKITVGAAEKTCLAEFLPSSTEGFLEPAILLLSLFASQKPLMFVPLFMKKPRFTSDAFYTPPPLLTYPCWEDKLKTHETIKQHFGA